MWVISGPAASRHVGGANIVPQRGKRDRSGVEWRVTQKTAQGDAVAKIISGPYCSAAMELLI